MSDAAAEYVIQYGRPGFVGRFAAAGPTFARGDRVVVRTARGVELGTVLCEPAARFAHVLGTDPDGDLLRAAGTDDLSETDHLIDAGRALLAAADRLAAESDAPVTFLDAEVLIGGTVAVLHVVAFGDIDLSPLLQALSREAGMTIRLHDAGRAAVAKDAPEVQGCGKPDCGSGSGGCSSCGTGGGCSTGGCSRASVKSADELTAYFADLRQKMDAHFGNGRTSLH